MMRAFLPTLAASAFTLLLLAACDGAQTSVGTNTNWLRMCDETAECDAEDSCVCRRCTRGCTSDADCPEMTYCAGVSASRLQCQGAIERTCQPGCSTDLDCEPGRLCHESVCVDGLAESICPDAALACEDFEVALGGDLPVITEGNTLERVAAQTPSGSFALRAGITGAPSVSYLRSDLPPQTSGELFLSAWVQIPEAPEHDVAPLGFWTATDEDWALRTVIRNGQLELWTYTDAIAGPFELTTPGWHCLKLHLTIDDALGTVQVSVDGQMALSASNVDTLPTGGIQSLAMGALWAGHPSDVLVDRVILSATDSSCYGD